MAEYKERQTGTENPEKIVINNDTIIDIEADSNAVLPREVAKWMEKVEGSVGPNSQAGVTDDKTGQPLLSPSAPVNPIIVLPISKRVFAAGFKKTVVEAGKWLSTFILRLIKIKKGKVSFKK